MREDTWSKVNMNKELMAFWPYYGETRHFAWGTVTDIRDDGSVEIQETGKGYYLKPLLLLPVESGKVLSRTLQELETRHIDQIMTLRKNQFKEVAEAVKGWNLPFKKGE